MGEAPEQLLRPAGLVVGGRLELGLEVVRAGGRVIEIRPHTGVPDAYVLSPAFVNAHSHLEYRAFLGLAEGRTYWPWIRELVRLKPAQSPAELAESQRRAARENRRTGVALVGEHQDRLGSLAALREAGCDAVGFQELVTISEGDRAGEKLRAVEERAREQRESTGFPVYPSPHALHTVDEESLLRLARSGHPLSLHVAETPFESQLFRQGEGPLAELFRERGREVPASGETVGQRARRLGLVRPGVQFVHGCDLEEEDLVAMSREGVALAHCPRSNRALGCPIAPIRRALETGVTVGLGLDSAASSGPIDMFAEMRAALEAARERGEPLAAEQVWRMATSEAAASLGRSGWEIFEGSAVPLIAIEVDGVATIEEVIEKGEPERVRWV